MGIPRFRAYELLSSPVLVHAAAIPGACWRPDNPVASQENDLCKANNHKMLKKNAYVVHLAS